MRFLSFFLLIFSIQILIISNSVNAQDPVQTVDLRGASTADGNLLRVYGSDGDGRFGVPVAGSRDCNGDGYNDIAVGYFTASPLARSSAGEVNLVFGTGDTSGTFNTAINQQSILRIYGNQITENCGSEIWMDEVTGDDYGDLIICRQNYSVLPDRVGVGALTILVGGPEVGEFANTLQPLDLRNPSTSVTLVNFYGNNLYDRLGIWVRTGDVDGDGTADILVGADQADFGESNQGSGWLIRGGSHLANSQTIDLSDFGSTALEGHIAHIINPNGGSNEHLGATCQIADLDGNGRAEVILSAALNRAGAALRPNGAPFSQYQATGGYNDGFGLVGRVYISWDDNFSSGLWADGFSFDVQDPPGSKTVLTGTNYTTTFGEEVIGGLDYDGDGNAELFIGDLVAEPPNDPSRGSAGVGFVMYNAQLLKGLEYDLDDQPTSGISFSIIAGPEIGAIGSDTVAQGDFDGDGFGDLMIGNPKDMPLGRASAGSMHILFGQDGKWPDLIDTAPGMLPDPSEIRIALVMGDKANSSGNSGDTLCYSAASGDVDGDGIVDLIVNEMEGDGVLPGAVDVGNLIVLSGVQFAVPSVVELRNELLGIENIPFPKSMNKDVNRDGDLDIGDIIELINE